MLRWQRLERDLGPADGPSVQVVPLAEVPAHLPHTRPAHPRAVRRADRRPAALRRPKDDQLTTTADASTRARTDTRGGVPDHDAIDAAYAPLPLLADKVVVLSGVGPGLGRALGEEAARMGADLVLVSRTASRLEKMADVVRSHGRRALVVPTDVTDEDGPALRWSRARWRSSAGSTA